MRNAEKRSEFNNRPITIRVRLFVDAIQLSKSQQKQIQCDSEESQSVVFLIRINSSPDERQSPLVCITRRCANRSYQQKSLKRGLKRRRSD